MSPWWSHQRVLLTGGNGFLGRVVLARIRDLRPAEVFAPRRSELDLRDASAVRSYLQAHRPTLVIHAAARVGGIGANQRHPGSFFFDNAVMGIHLIDECRRAETEKFVCIGTTCAYPKFAPLPFREHDLWNGYPEETNAPYGVAKRVLLTQLQAYRAEYGFSGIYLVPANLYGPGDHVEPATSHVIPSMIRKFLEATRSGRSTVVLWGDGTPTREFLYIEDAAEGILLAAERYEGADAVNLGSGEERSIAEIARTIAGLTDYRGDIVWDTTRPNGQPRRRLDTTRAETFGFRARTPFTEGLRRTIEWQRTLPVAEG